MYHYNSGYLHRHFDEIRQSMENAAVSSDDAGAGDDETCHIDDVETGNNDAESIA